MSDGFHVTETLVSDEPSGCAEIEILSDSLPGLVRV